ncbi:MAG TPA: hypothetical protein VFW98_08210 [Gemmatimonadaceae bacterium]|nr:hypothetical protein [Gemmatimonadaceae bacterium]
MPTPPRPAAPAVRLLPHHPDIPTSRDNARHQTKRYPLTRRRILDYLQRIRLTPLVGATRAELARELGMPIQSVCPAVCRLRQDHEIEQTETRRNGGYLLVARHPAQASHAA